MFELDVSQAFVRPMVEFDFSVEVTLENQQINGDDVCFAPVKVEGVYSMADDVIRLKGHLHTTAYAPCAVCLAPTQTRVELDFAESFRKDANEEEDGFFPYEGKHLPLDHMVLTLVLLNLPMRFTCEGGCVAAAELKPWDEDKTVWSEEIGEPQGAYHPFEGLQEMLQSNAEQ